AYIDKGSQVRIFLYLLLSEE
ncbi:hypothetical protein CA163_26520, partial [Vibrio parahaemolyticus]